MLSAEAELYSKDLQNNEDPNNAKDSKRKTICLRNRRSCHEEEYLQVKFRCLTRLVHREGEDRRFSGTTQPPSSMTS